MTAGPSSLPEALELARSLDSTLEQILDTETLLERAAESDLDGDVHAELASLGWAGIAIAEADGGLGLTASGHALLAAVAGARLLPAAMRGEAFVLAPLLAARARTGADSTRDQLDGLLAGELRGGGTVSVSSEEPQEPEVLRAFLAPGARLLGHVSPSGAFLIDLTARGVTVEPFQALDAGQGAAVVHVDDVQSMRVELTRSDRASLLATWRLGMVAEAYGVGRQALEAAVTFSGQREQFGRRISGFQAVAHMLANAAVGLEAANAGIGRLAYGIEAGDDIAGLELVLSHTVPAASRQACEASIQVHGGMGFTWELGLHLYYRRALELQYLLGGSWETAREIGEHYLATRPPMTERR